MKIRAIDFETTGGVPDEVCEVGYADLTLGDLTIGRRFSALVFYTGAMSAAARGVHHISPSEIVLDGVGRENLDEILLEDHPDKIFAAHNAASDSSLWSPPGARWICTYKCAYRAYDLPDYKLQTLRYGLDLERCGTLRPTDATAHRAGPDAYIAALLLARIIADRPNATIERMVEITNSPLVLRRCPINPHRDKPFSEIEDKFLEWVVGKAGDMSADLVHTARLHLEVRRKKRSEAM